MKPKSYITGAWGWTASTSSNGYDASQKNIIVSNLGHAIFNWPYPISMINTNEVQVLSSVTNSKGLTYMDPASFTTTSSSSISSIAIVKGSSGTAQSSILEIPVNTVIAGTTVLQKFVQVGYAADSYSNVTTDGIKIILNTCYYLMGMSKPTAIKIIPALDEKICLTLIDNTLIIDFPDTDFGNAIINIYTVSGQKVFSGTRPVNPYGRIEVNLGILKSGLYFCNIQNKNRATTLKFIKI
jgi:hypothetical protein